MARVTAIGLRVHKIGIRVDEPAAIEKLPGGGDDACRVQDKERTRRRYLAWIDLLLSTQFQDTFFSKLPQRHGVLGLGMSIAALVSAGNWIVC